MWVEYTLKLKIEPRFIIKDETSTSQSLTSAHMVKFPQGKVETPR